VAKTRLSGSYPHEAQHGFRLYNDVINDPKVQLLPKALRWAWIEMLCLASKNDGFLPTVDQIAFSVRASVNDAQSDLDALVLAGLIDITPEGRLTPHNWSERQFASDSSRERTRNYRERMKKRSGDSDVTSQVTAQDQTRSDQSRSETDPDQNAQARESLVEVKSDFVGQGRGGSVSVEARRKVCAQLAIGNADPLVALYEAWKPSSKARDPDALFISQAARFYAEAPPAVTSACLPLPDRPPDEPLPPVHVSPQLASKLKQEKRHGVRTN